MSQSRSWIVLAFSALVLCAGASVAQDLEKLRNSTPEQRATIQTEYMTTNLALTAEQVPKVKAINLASAQKAEPILKGSEGPLIRMRQLKVLDEAKDAQLRTVFSAEQYGKYLGLKEKLREHLESKLAGGPG